MHHSSRPKIDLRRFRWISVLIPSFIVFLPYTVHSLTEISGDIGQMTLTAEGGPYIVVNDLTIPEGENAVIGEGCRLFFKPFTGIIVDGNITVAGTQDHPVLFTSINDSLSPYKKEQLPNPFDWNGIHVKDDVGKVTFSHFTLAYSVYGIKSQKASIVIDNGTFRQNGQFHFTIMDAPMPVADNIPYSYSGHTVTYLPNGATSGEAPVDSERYREGTTVALAGNIGNLEKTGYAFAGWNSSADGSGTSYSVGTSIVIGQSDVTLYTEWKRSNEAAGGGTVVKKSKRSVFIKKGVPAVVGGTGVVSGIVSLVFLNRWMNQRDEYRTSSSPDRRSELEDEGKLSSSVAIGTGVVSVAAITTGVVLYWWWNLHEEKPVAVVPVILPRGAGAAVAVKIR